MTSFEFIFLLLPKVSCRFFICSINEKTSILIIYYYIVCNRQTGKTFLSFEYFLFKYIKLSILWAVCKTLIITI